MSERGLIKNHSKRSITPREGLYSVRVRTDPIHNEVIIEQLVNISKCLC